MSQQKSIADQFIETMAALRDIEPTNDEPMRHQMRTIRRIAELSIENALRNAWELAYYARNLPKESKAITDEALKAQMGGEGK